MRFREGDVLPKIIIHKTIVLVVIMLVFIVLCDFGFKEVLEPYRIPLATLSVLWLLFCGFTLFIPKRLDKILRGHLRL